jgi:hypothetical protein
MHSRAFLQSTDGGDGTDKRVGLRYTQPTQVRRRLQQFTMHQNPGDNTLRRV